MINFAHRGASGDYPENTLLAFKKAIELGGEGIELDVHKSKDGKLVVIHDEDIERTHLGRGLVKDYNYSELIKFKNRKILFKNHKMCFIPTLEEVLQLLKNNNIYLNIELKTDQIHYENIEKDVIGLVNKYNMNNRVLLSSFNHDSIVMCKSIDTSIKTGVLYHTPMDNIVRYAKELKADAINSGLTLVKEELIKEAHDNGLEVNVWTVNYPVYMRMLIKGGADGIFTDYPHLLKDIRDNTSKV